MGTGCKFMRSLLSDNALLEMSLGSGIRVLGLGFRGFEKCCLVPSRSRSWEPKAVTAK